jgi:hypothetical protein
MAIEIVPFGKYKGQPIDVLAQDRQYCDWIVQQSWFSQRYPALSTLIINNFGEPSETPEHNRLQLRFLDAHFLAQCSRLLLEAFPSEGMRASDHFLPMPMPVFEEDGIDVWWQLTHWDCRETTDTTETPTVLQLRYTQERQALLKKFCGDSRWIDTMTAMYFDRGQTTWSQVIKEAQAAHEAATAKYNIQLGRLSIVAGYSEAVQRLKALFQPQWDAATRTRQEAETACMREAQAAMDALQARWASERPFFTNRATTNVICPTPAIYNSSHRRPAFAIECKPSLGDDYPAVLRFLKSLVGQTRHKIQDCHKAVVVERFAAQGGTLAQVKTFFRQSEILLLTVEEIDACKPLAFCAFDGFVTGHMPQTWWHFPQQEVTV